MEKKQQSPAEMRQQEEKRTQALQTRYLTALVRLNPGLGKKTEEVALYLANIGLKQGEVMALLNTVYLPTHKDGRGQAQRAIYFTKALVNRYGERYLANIRQNLPAFLGFLGQVSEAVDMRDEVNDALKENEKDRANISFYDALALEVAGLSTEAYLGYLADLKKQTGCSNVKAVVVLKKAIEEVNKGRVGELEALIFRGEFDEEAQLPEERDE
jgi:hypothetical protein